MVDLEGSVGKVESHLDAQGRLVLPTHVRRELSLDDAAVPVCVRIESDLRCLRIETLAAWKQTLEVLRDLAASDARCKLMLAHQLAHADESSADRQGRIRIAQHLMEVARIVAPQTKRPLKRVKVILTGGDRCLYLWSPGNWESFHSSMLANAEVDTTHLMKLVRENAREVRDG